MCLFSFRLGNYKNKHVSASQHLFNDFGGFCFSFDHSFCSILSRARAGAYLHMPSCTLKLIHWMIMSTGPLARRETKIIVGPKPRVCMFLRTAFNNDLKQPDVPRMQTLNEEQEHLHIILTSISLKHRRQVAWSLIYRWEKPAVQPACLWVGPGGQWSPHPTAAYMDVTTMITSPTHHWADSPRQTYETFESRDTTDLVSWLRDITVIECLQYCTRCLICAVLLSEEFHSFCSADEESRGSEIKNWVTWL